MGLPPLLLTSVLGMSGSVLLSHHLSTDGATSSSPALAFLLLLLLLAILPVPRQQSLQGRRRQSLSRTKLPTQALGPGSSLLLSAALSVKHKLSPGQLFSLCSASCLT